MAGGDAFRTPETTYRYIAMWSGPRNISTALLRAWENRPDTYVCDEPLYAHYLQQTGLDHPGRDEVIASQETDWRRVVEWLTGAVPENKWIFYQKHMAHHLLPNVERGWVGLLTNAFLIRDPAEMLPSLHKVTPNPHIEDTGLPQQCELFDQLRDALGSPPPVIDSRDVLMDPRRVLNALCDSLGVGFTDAMLSWPPGPRDTDGVWAPHWYASVERSTGFEPYRPKSDAVPEELSDLYSACMPYYVHLYHHRITG